MKRKVYQTRLYNENKRKKRREDSFQSIIKGDETEKYVFDIFKTFKDIEDVQIIGNNGGMFDISYKYKGDVTRAVQVKTLTQFNEEDTWRSKFEREYLEDTLIILVNQERNRFGLVFYRDVKVKTLSLGFKNLNKGKYRYNKYIDYNKFVSSLYRRSKVSSVFDLETNFSPSIKKEFDSIQRLEKKCNENNLSFKRSTTNGSVIDCCIKDKNVQCKYCSTLLEDKYCKFNLTKSNGKVDGVQKSQCYNEKDPIDYFIFEIGGTLDDLNKYQNNFCIIPKEVLVEKGILTTKEKQGKKSFYVYPPDSKINHWTVKWWNTFEF